MKTHSEKSDDASFDDVMDDRAFKVRSKVWLELDGRPFLGEGRYDLLKAIDRLGSLVRASEETRIPYRRIKGVIRDMEEALGLKLVVTLRGGREGGGASITALTRELLQCFEKQEQGVRERIDTMFQRIFRKKH